jgi:MFS family permease
MKLFYGWIVVAAGGLLGCVAIGAVFSLAVFRQPMADATGWSRTGVSSAMTIVFLTMGIASFGWGALTDRFGPLPVVLSGGVLLGLGLALASRATSLLEFQLIYGLLVGGATGAVFVPTMTMMTGWFEKHRSLAVSLVSAGMGMAPMTLPFASWLITNYRLAHRPACDRRHGVGDPRADGLAGAPRTPVIDERERVATAPGVTMGAAEPDSDAGQALRSPQFWCCRSPTSAAAPPIRVRSSIR